MWCKVAPDDGATTTNEQQQQRQQLGSNCFYTMPGLCSTDTVEFFRIVRLVCVKPTASPVTDLGLDLPPSIVYPISYETFVPDLVQRQQHASLSSVSSLSARFHVDKMTDTFAKVAAFLHHSGTPARSVYYIGHWLRQLGGTGGHASPSTFKFQLFNFWVTSEPHKL